MTLCLWTGNLNLQRRLSATSVLTRLVRLSNALLKKPGEDGEINNQRKAFLDMAWSGGELITDVENRNHGYDVIVGGELFTDYSDHPRKLVTLNPKLKSTGAGLQLLSRWWDALPQAAWPERLLSEKSGRCGIAAD